MVALSMIALGICTCKKGYEGHGVRYTSKSYWGWVGSMHYILEMTALQDVNIS